MINYFNNRRELKQKAKALYERAEIQGRLPVFYADLGVPDSVDGRFEMISLHCYILMHRLQRNGDKKLSQKLFDVFFRHMDYTLREMGIGDLGVPKHMKRMMQGFNGRATHYETAVKNNDTDALKQALENNVYGTVDHIDESYLSVMMEYIHKNIAVETAEEGFIAPKLEITKEDRAHG